MSGRGRRGEHPAHGMASAGAVQRARVLFGISVFWLALSMVFEGFATLVLPEQLLGLVDEPSKATTLGLAAAAWLLRRRRRERSRWAWIADAAKRR